MFGKKKGFCILHGTDVDVFYLKKLDYVDHACYEEKYWGDEYNTIMRYEKNPDSYIFVEDLETGNLAGYLNFFPCEDKLYQDNLWRSEVIRDDDILPEEIAEYRAEGNHLFIMSFAIHPDYQGTEVIRLLSDDFITWLNQKEADGFPITDIAATAVSSHGKKALVNYLFRELRVMGDGNTVYLCDEIRLRKLLAHDLYFKSYQDDLYLFLPMAEHSANLRVSRFVKEQKKREGDPLTALLMEQLQNYLSYECSNAVVRDMDLIDLGCFDFLHTTDDYPLETFGDKDGATVEPGQKYRWVTNAEKQSDDPEEEQEIVIGDVRGHVVLTAHRKTHLFVLTIMFHSYPYSTTQMMDQMSYGYLKIRDPENPKQYVPFYEYLLQNFGLHACGPAKCLDYMSAKPVDEREFQDILAAEAFNNMSTEYDIDSDELREMCQTNRAQFSDYEAYLSSRSIAYVKNDFAEKVEDRICDVADYLFIVILVLFQNTALEKVNTKVTDLLENEGEVSFRIKLEIDQEYGKTIRFWEKQNFKYLASQQESTVIREAFLNDELKQEYAEHQDFLNQIVDVKAAISESRTGLIINVVAIILAVISVQPFFVEILQVLYKHLDIQAAYADSTYNYTLFGGIVAFIVIYNIIRRKRHISVRR